MLEDRITVKGGDLKVGISDSTSGLVMVFLGCGENESCCDALSFETSI